MPHPSLMGEILRQYYLQEAGRDHSHKEVAGVEDAAVHLLNSVISTTHKGGDPWQFVLHTLLGGV